MHHYLEKVTLFWRNSGVDTKRKLQIYDAIIRAKLVYGLETVQLTESMISRITAFQMRGLRQILGIDHTYVNRTNTNKFLLQKANDMFGPNHSSRIHLITHYIHQRAHSLMSHIIRADNSDPLRQVALLPDTAMPMFLMKRRVGRPRKQWTSELLREKWTQLQNAQGVSEKEEYCQYSEDQSHEIMMAAQLYLV